MPNNPTLQDDLRRQYDYGDHEAKLAIHRHLAANPSIAREAESRRMGQMLVEKWRKRHTS